MQCRSHLGSDQLPVGYLYPPQPLDVELRNICESQKLAGSSPEDYGVIANVPRGPAGTQPVINKGLRVKWVERPAVAAARKARESGQQKLMALGLTDAEIRALGWSIPAVSRVEP